MHRQDDSKPRGSLRRTPIKNKGEGLKRTGIKRGGSSLLRKKINPVSTKEKGRQKEYAAKQKQDQKKDLACIRCGTDLLLQRHHPRGRQNILDYVYVCAPCHSWIHENPIQAREQNYLT